MKKNSFFLLLFMILLIILGFYIWLTISCVQTSNNFFDVTIVDLINIALDIVLGGVLVCILYFFTNENSDLNNRKAIANESLNKIKFILDEIKSPKEYTSLSDPWNNALLAKTNIKLNLRLLSQLKNLNPSFVACVDGLSSELDRYFEFYEATFYEKAILEEKDFDEERLIIGKIKYSIIDAISKLY